MLVSRPVGVLCGSGCLSVLFSAAAILESGKLSSVARCCRGNADREKNAVNAERQQQVIDDPVVDFQVPPDVVVQHGIFQANEG